MTPSPTSEPELVTEPAATGSTAPDSTPTDSNLTDSTPTTDSSVAPDSTPTPAPAAENSAAGADESAAAEDLDDDEDDEDFDGGAGYPPTEPGHYDTLFPLAGAVIGLVALIAVMIGAFGLPARHYAPNHLPIGVAGAPAVTTNLKKLFTQTSPKSYDVTVYSQESALRTAIQHRKVYGGLSVSSASATMLISTAASPVAAQNLATIANQLASSNQVQIAVTDVVPMPKRDPRGDGLGALAIPLVLASLLPALLMFQVYRRRASAQLAATLGASVLAGFALSAVLNYVVGSTHGSNFWLVGLGLTAGIASASLILLGLGAIGDWVGIGVGAVLLFLVGAPLSGLSTAPEWLPGHWGTIGQLLPAGAGATVLRSVAYFHSHGAATAILVLTGWALFGLLFFVLGTALLGPSALKPEPEPTAGPPLELNLSH